MSEDRLNDKEWADLQNNHALFKGAVAEHGPEKIKQALRDMVQLPSKRGDLNS
jgi:hypothetical protein